MLLVRHVFVLVRDPLICLRKSIGRMDLQRLEVQSVKTTFFLWQKGARAGQ